MDRTALILPLLSALGCGLGALDELAEAHVCDEQGGTDARCPANVASSTGDITPTTSGPGDGSETTMLPGVLTTTDAPPDLPGESTATTDAPPAAPEIVSVELDPDTLDRAAPIAVKVEALHATSVTMALDGGQPVSLAASGANFYKGSIEVHGASMNGSHAVLITAASAGLQDTQAAGFTLDAPPPGQNMWLRTNDVPDSQTRAIAVDTDSNVYEVGTAGTGAAARRGHARFPFQAH